MTLRKILLLSLLSACGSDDGDDGDIVAECAGEHLTLTGAVDLDTDSVATVELDNAVIGVGGFLPGATQSYAFTVRDVLTAQLATVGVHDVTSTNVKYLSATANADCQTAGACTGFVATAGTFEVTGTAPYTATFTLEGLHQFDGSSDALGVPIAGTVTGCLVAAP